MHFDQSRSGLLHTWCEEIWYSADEYMVYVGALDLDVTILFIDNYNHIQIALVINFS